MMQIENISLNALLMDLQAGKLFKRTKTTRKTKMNNEERTIECSEIDNESFKNGYKKCFREICEMDDWGQSSHKIKILFKADGSFSGHVWENNCGYSTSDLEKNGDYKLDYMSPWLEETLDEWRDEVREELNTMIDEIVDLYSYSIAIDDQKPELLKAQITMQEADAIIHANNDEDTCFKIYATGTKDEVEY